ncbi:MAG TPA: efflux RND transporter periplasmic adaptor subunit [Sulfuriferula sp.]|nr:efflux RND transporter periplasmic adaptor subunit [Sulfuriferula sp.]
MNMPVLAAALCLACTLTAHASSDVVLSATQVKNLSISTTPLRLATSAPGLAYPATVIVPPSQLRIVAAPMTGLLTSVLVASHDTVKLGQPLARLSSLALAEAQGSLIQAAAQAQLARENLKRDTTLLAEGIIPASRQQAARAASVSANAMLTQQRQSLRMSGVPEASIRQMEAGRASSAEISLTAPIAGSVLEVSATPGQRVDANMALFKIAKLSPLWLEMQLPAVDAASVRPGDAVSVSGGNVQGRVLSVARASSASQTVMVRAEIQGALEGLVAGQAVGARIAQTQTSGWQVPAAAVVRQKNQAYLFVRSARGFTPVPVSVLGQSGDTARVAGALQAGQQVAVRGVGQIKAVWMGIGGE